MTELNAQNLEQDFVVCAPFLPCPTQPEKAPFWDQNIEPKLESWDGLFGVI